MKFATVFVRQQRKTGLLLAAQPVHYVANRPLYSMQSKYIIAVSCIKTCLFVCFKGGTGTPLPDKRVRICRDPQSCEFPPHHYSGLGTRKVRQTFGIRCRKSKAALHLRLLTVWTESNHLYPKVQLCSFQFDSRLQACYSVRLLKPEDGIISDLSIQLLDFARQVY